MNREQLKKAQSKAGAGVAGIGGGTLLVTIAESLPPEHPARGPLLFAAPWASTFASLAWLWIRRTMTRRMQERKMDSLCEKARNALDHALEDPRTSPGHRAKLQQGLEELELLRLQWQLDQAHALDPELSVPSVSRKKVQPPESSRPPTKSG